MIDCPNGDVRDLLPELLNDRLDETSRRRVESHVAGCADCREELALLADMRTMMHARPAIDVAAVTAALPVAVSRRAAATRGTRLGWRTAAAITMLAAGGTSLALIQRNPVPATSRDSVAIAMQVPDGTESVSAARTPGAASVGPVVGAAIDTPAATPVATRTPRAAPSTASPGSSDVGRRELAIAGSAVGDLTDGELAALLSHIDGLDGVPSPDVESVDLSPLPPRTVRP